VYKKALEFSSFNLIKSCLGFRRLTEKQKAKKANKANKKGEKKGEKMRAFLERKNITFSTQRYLIDAMGAMALGLFASLLIGTIMRTFGELTGLETLLRISVIASLMTGPAIAVAVASALKAPPLVLFSSCVVGAAAHGLTVSGVAVAGFTGGGPVGALVAACCAAEVGKAVSKETKIDILVTPTVTILTGVFVGTYIGLPISALMDWLGSIINFATQQHPVVMGMLVSATMGIVLTSPISSAALAVSLGLSGIAAGAATVGGASQMVGFAFMSFRENGWGGLAAQGLGTSMLQMPNIIKNWRIWIPPILTSVVLGPLSAAVFGMENIPIAAGMGTCGLVGQIGTVTAMVTSDGGNTFTVFLSVALLHFILPALLTLGFAAYLRKIGWIKDGDLKLDL